MFRTSATLWWKSFQEVIDERIRFVQMPLTISLTSKVMLKDSEIFDVRIIGENLNSSSPSSDSSLKIIGFALEALCFIFRISCSLGEISTSSTSTSVPPMSLSPAKMSTSSPSSPAELSESSSAQGSKSPTKCNWITFWSKACAEQSYEVAVTYFQFQESPLLGP